MSVTCASRLTPADASARTSLEVHDTKGQLLSRSEEEFAACNGELRLVSVAAARAPSVVVVEVATIPDDSCSVPNQVRAYRIGASQVPHEPAPAAEPTVCAPGQQPIEAERLTLEPYQRSDLAVFRVAPGDTLNLRASPGARASVVDPPPFLLEGLRHTGRACRADGGLWLEVEYGARRGWVNQRYVSPAAAFRSVEAIGEKPVAQFAAPTLAELARRVRQAIASEQSALAGAALDVEVVGHHEQQGIGQIVLFTTPMGDDSISGSSTWLTPSSTPGSGSWSNSSSARPASAAAATGTACDVGRGQLATDDAARLVPRLERLERVRGSW